jgi:hypothetical protein
MKCTDTSARRYDALLIDLGLLRMQALRHMPALDVGFERNVHLGQRLLFLVGLDALRRLRHQSQILCQQFVR